MVYVFPTAEHAYHYDRAMKQNKRSLADQILQAPHAGAVKYLSRNLDPTVNKLLDVKLMLDILLAKAEQNTIFRKSLRDAAERPLIHSTSRNDTFWASGLLPRDDHSRLYPGRNVFGYLLHIVRGTLRPESLYSQQQCPTPLMDACPPPPLPRKAPLLSVNGCFTSAFEHRQPI